MTQRHRDEVPGILENVIMAVLEDRISDAERLLLQVDGQKLLTERNDQFVSVSRRRRSALPNQAPSLLVDVLARPSDQKARDREVFERDSYICRYCGMQTIAIPILNALVGTLSAPGLLPSPPKSSNWKPKEQHILYWTVTPANDHLFPKSRGGSDALRNRVTACAPCNDAKSGYTLEELGWTCREPVYSSWNGLSEYEELLQQRGIAALNEDLPIPATDSPKMAVSIQVRASHECESENGSLQPGFFIFARRPGQAYRFKNVVENVKGDIVEIRRLWIDDGVWAAERDGWKGRADELSGIELISTVAPKPGDRLQ